MIKNEILNKLTTEQKKLLEKKLRERKLQKLQNNQQEIKHSREKSKNYPISASQEKIWRLCKLYEPTSIYNIGGVAKIKGNLDVDVLEEGFRMLISKHEILRTVFVEEDGVFGKVLNDISFYIKKVENVFFSTDVDKNVKKFIQMEKEKILDLRKGPCFNVNLINIKEDEWVLLLIVHHIISDGISTHIIFRELIEYYEMHMGYKGIEEKSLKIQFGDFAWWEKNKIKEDINDQISHGYWEKRLNKINQKMNFFEECRQLKQTEALSIKKDIKLEKELVLGLQDIAKKEKITLFSILLGSLYLVFNKYSDQDDLLIGVLTSGRDENEIADLIGCFISVLPVRSNINKENSILNYMKDVYSNFIADFGQKKGILSNKLKEPEYQVLFSYEVDPESNIEVKGLDMSFEEIDTGYCRSEIEIELNRLGDYINGWLNFRKDLFDERFIEQFILHYKNVLYTVLNYKYCAIKDMEIINDEERQQIDKEFNPPDTEFDKDMTIQELFLQSVKVNSEKIALIMGDEEVSYKELNKLSNSIANQLIRKGVELENKVGIIADRGIGLIAGILGIIKSGAAYVPIDGNTPKERINFMLEDSKVKLLLTDLNPMEVNDLGLSVETIDLLQCFLNQEDCEKEVFIKGDVHNLAYVMYTSGTTGMPKGVLIEHINIVSTVMKNRYITYEDNDRLLQLSNYAFDGSVFDIFGALLNGVGLVLLKQEEVIDIHRISDVIREKNVTILFITTALFNAIVDININCLGNLKKIYFGGERASVEHVIKAYDYMGKNKIYNIYGPTETTVFSTYYPIDDNIYKMNNIPIGKPLSNRKVKIVNITGNTQPIGVKGEILIGGTGVARGYLNRDELEREKFITFKSNRNQRYYKSGDVGKWLPDGNIQFCGRVDDQVKYRGFRIELAEVEKAILQYKEIEKSIVVLKESSERGKILCGYIIVNDNYSEKQLKEFLMEKLPEYMIPNYFVVLKEFPINKNGKIEKSFLPLPEINGESLYVSPRNDEEWKMAEIWQEVLGVKKIGITDDFFENGGHSIKLTEMCAKVEKKMNIKIPLKVVFTNHTIEQIYKKIDNSWRINNYRKISKLEDAPYYETSSTQKRMYFLFDSNKKSTAYNIPFAVKITGSIDLDKIEACILKLIKRHEILRSRFDVIQGEVIQIVENIKFFKIPFIESKKKLEDFVEEFIKPFDLSIAPLFRIQLIKIHENQYYFMGDFHHIIFDGVSLELFLNEFGQLYLGKELNQNLLQYRDYAKWHNRFLISDKINKQRQYWKKQFDTIPEQLTIGLDFQRPNIKKYDGEIVYFSIDEELTKEIREIAKITKVTLNVVFLSIYNLLLWKYTGQEDIVVGVPVAGRQNADTQSIIGMFLNTLALRNYPESNKTVMRFIEEVNKNFIDGFENQDYPFECLINEIGVKRSKNRNPLFDTMFIMQNGFKWGKRLGDMDFELCNINYKTAKFDFQIEVYEKEYVFDCLIGYATDLFEKNTIERLISDLKKIASWVCHNLNKPLKEIDIFDEDALDLLEKFSGDFEG